MAIAPAAWFAYSAGEMKRTVVLFAALATLAAQTRVDAPPAQFALEVSIPGTSAPRYLPVLHRRSSFLYASDLKVLPGRDPNGATPTALRFECDVQGSIVEVTGSLIYGAFDLAHVPGSLIGLPQRKVGTWEANLSQSVVLSELERFGIEPVSLRLVPASGADVPQPRTATNVPSLALEIAGADRVKYKIEVRNLSSRGVLAFHINPAAGAGSGTKPAIAPGGTRDIIMPVPRNGPPSVVVLDAAVFDDGTWEGEVHIAAMLAARHVGDAFQYRQIGKAFDDAPGNKGMDDSAAVVEITAEIGKLSEEPEPGMIEQVRHQFPELEPDKEEDTILRSEIATALHADKQWILVRLKALQDGSSQRSQPTLAKWWNSLQ